MLTRLLSKFYFCCDLLHHFSLRILTYIRVRCGSALRCSLHLTSISEFEKKSGKKSISKFYFMASDPLYRLVLAWGKKCSKLIKKSVSAMRLLFLQLKYRFLPQSLLQRMLLIIIVPTILSQIIATFIFYNKHWDGVSKYMIYTLAGEVALITKTYKPKSTNEMVDVYTFLQYRFYPRKSLVVLDAKLPKELRTLQNHVQYNLPSNKMTVSFDKKSKEITLDIQIPEGVLSFEISNKRITATSTYPFILWMVGSAAILLCITILFARNQIRSLVRVSILAEKISRKEDVQRFNPQGALEVRRLGFALFKMKQSLEEQVHKKAQVLAGVSHDLRTPITRLRLELNLMKNTKLVENIKSDLNQIDNTVNDYLRFVQGEHFSSRTLVDLNKFLYKVRSSLGKGNKIEIAEHSRKIYLTINENEFLRAISNFLENADRYASKIEIIFSETEHDINIEIHDNGPGIPKPHMQYVAEPFYKLDRYAHKKHVGVGLGLAIAKDIITSHNGVIHLAKSKRLGGLKVVIALKKLKMEQCHLDLL